MKPLAIDLFCGLGGWTRALLEIGYYVVGFDIERHEYDDLRYPGEIVLQDVRTLDGRQFRGAALIVASPPCQAYSYRAMPWTRALPAAAEQRAVRRVLSYPARGVRGLRPACPANRRERARRAEMGRASPRALWFVLSVG